jgi:hypothetical protein
MTHCVDIELVVHGTAFGKCNGKPFVAELEINPRAFTGEWRCEATRNQRLNWSERRVIVPKAIAEWARAVRYAIPSPN